MALALPLAGSPALAQGVNSGEVWSRWQEEVAKAGGRLSAGHENREGNQLRLNDLSFQPNLDAPYAPTVLLEEVILINRADGSVGIALPENFTLRLQSKQPQSDEIREARFNVAAPKLELAIMGVGERGDFFAKAPSLSVTLDGITPPPSLNEPDLTFMLALADLDLRYQQDLGNEALWADGALSLGTLHGAFAIQSGDAQNVDIRFDLAGAKAQLSAAVPPAAVKEAKALTARPDPEAGALPAILAALEAGTFFDLKGEIGATEFVVRGDDQGEAFEVDWRLAGADSLLRLNKEELRSEIGLTGFALQTPATTLDLPAENGIVGLQFDRFRHGMALGLNGLKAAQSWNYLWRLDNLGTTEAGWGLLDSMLALPHEPVSFLMDLSGQYSVKPEVLDGSYAPQSETDLPLDSFSVKINGLNLAGLGAAFESRGALKILLDDFVSYGGFPAPSGKVEAKTTGLNALINRLVDAGLIEKDQLFGLRAGVAMFGKATNTPDVLETELEFAPPHISLNGVKIR